MNQKKGGWSLEQRDPQEIEKSLLFWRWFYDHYFQVKSDGWEFIPDQQVLYVGSHNGGLAAPDMFMFMYDWFRRFRSTRIAYGLMHPKIWEIYPFLAPPAEKLGAIVAHPKMAIKALQTGADVLVYPGGAQDVFRPHSQRQKINLAGRTGFIQLALKFNIPIVPVVSWGAHDTLYVVDNIYDPLNRFLKQFHLPWLFNIDPEVFPIYLGLPWGLCLGPLPNFPLPHPIHLRIGKPIYLDIEEKKSREYLNLCYHRVEDKMQTLLNGLISDCEKEKNSLF